MKIFFVRHGESEGNASDLRQGFSGSLTEKGRNQAHFIGKRLKNITIDQIVCSPSDRAKQTGEIIAEHLGKAIEFCDLFIERTHPSEIIGKPRKSEESLKIRDAINDHFHEPEWRYSDEENFEDLKKRALTAIQYLESQNKENLLVVTHGVFLRVIFACIIMGKELTSHEFWKFLLALTMENTGISVVEQKTSKFDKGIKKEWRVITWNDYAHLEDIT